MVDYHAVLFDLTERRAELDAGMRAIRRIVGEATQHADARREPNARESVTSTVTVPYTAAMQRDAAATPEILPAASSTAAATETHAPTLQKSPTAPEQTAATQSKGSYLNGVSLRSAADGLRKAQTGPVERMPYPDGIA
jgi:hypothetical protein